MPPPLPSWRHGLAAWAGANLIGSAVGLVYFRSQGIDLVVPLLAGIVAAACSLPFVPLGVFLLEQVSLLKRPAARLFSALVGITFLYVVALTLMLLYNGGFRNWQIAALSTVVLAPYYFGSLVASYLVYHRWLVHPRT